MDSYKQVYHPSSSRAYFEPKVISSGIPSRWAVKALGAQRWRTLHQTVYAIAGLAILHFFWMRSGKKNYAEVMVYATILGLLMGWRIWHQWKTKRAARVKL